MLVKLSGRILSVLVLDGQRVKLARCVEMDAGRPEEIESVLHPTVAYIEDELKAKPQQIWLCGFGARERGLRRALGSRMGRGGGAAAVALRHAGRE